MPFPQHTMRAGVIAQLLSSTLRGDSSDSDDSGSDVEHSSAARESQQYRSPTSSHSVHRSVQSPRRRHHASSVQRPHPTSASLRCRAAGCMQKQCADSVGGVCIAHAILSLPVQQLHHANTPHSLAAYQRKLRRQPQSQHIDNTAPTDTATNALHTHRQTHSRPSTAASTARSHSYQSYRRYHEDDGRKQDDANSLTTTAKLPDFTHRLPTVADLKQEGLQAFTASRSEAKRSKPNSRNNSRRNTATQWSATAPVSSNTAERPIETPSSYSSTLLFHPRRTPAGLTLERASTAADAVRLLRLAAHNRPHNTALTSTSATTSVKAATLAVMDSSIFPLPFTARDSSTDPLSARPPSALSVPPVLASHLLLLAPAKHMKVLSAVEEQRLYRADLLARLMQRPPVASLQSILLQRMERLFTCRPPYATLCSRQVIRSHSEHEAILAARQDKRRRLTVWLSTRCELSELYDRRALWDERDNVRSRTGRLDEWMAGRLTRHMAGEQRQQSTQPDGSMSRWHVSTVSGDDDVDSQSVTEPQLSIVVLEPSPRSAAMSGKFSAKGSPKLPLLSLTALTLQPH